MGVNPSQAKTPSCDKVKKRNGSQTWGVWGIPKHLSQ